MTELEHHIFEPGYMPGDMWGRGEMPMITIGRIIEDQKGNPQVELDGGGTMRLDRFKKMMEAHNFTFIGSKN